MKNFLIILVIIILGIFVYRAATPSSSVEEPVDVIESDEENLDEADTPPSSIIGCYVAGTENDVYTLTIKSQEGETVTGTLEFDNYQKDSSEGSFNGTFEGGILLGDYSFSSEGMDSVMEVIFKQQGEDFVRGYGEVTNEGTEFVDTQDIEYKVNDLSLFEKQSCAQV
tara:strand:- start:276 stop:779 length:504 start_codon:yes stop_codon:yes gene_type:complete